MLSDGVLPYQAGAFNGCCRIYAPRYRQAVLASFFADTPDTEGALDLAYSDVLRAFDYYIAHENHGRPFFIVAHSQGSLHAMRLVQERVLGAPLAKQLVAVYAVGSFLPADLAAKGLPACRSADQSGCAIDWNSVTADGAAKRNRQGLIWLDGRYQPAAGRQVVCVNPLNGRADAQAPASDNLGALPPSPGQAFADPIAGKIGAACVDGLLQIEIAPDVFWRFNNLATAGGVFHVLDYNLFYMNIRRDAGRRLAAYFAR
jgi:hypothetical protein